MPRVVLSFLSNYVWERSRRYESMGRDEPDETIVELDSIMDTLANVDDAEEDDDEVDNLLDAL